MRSNWLESARSWEGPTVRSPPSASVPGGGERDEPTAASRCSVACEGATVPNGRLSSSFEFSEAELVLGGSGAELMEGEEECP